MNGMGILIGMTAVVMTAATVRAGCPDGACAPASKAPAAETKARSNPHLDTETLATLIAARVPMVILDARTGKYDDGRRIPGAGSLSASATAEEAERAIGSKDALVVTYCSNLKCPASEALFNRLRQLGYKNVVEYSFGIEGWAAAGHEVRQAKK
ncbi:MAG: rhodanese-like domain-containing protein [Kiritimatiellae bacterium]|nr:rhodanese-like domain-containing protein [Kiritimatiellia bacterium]